MCHLPLGRQLAAVFRDRDGPARPSYGDDGDRTLVTDGGRPPVSEVSDESLIRERVHDHITGASVELFVLLPAGCLPAVEEILADAVDRGVHVNCMLAAPDVEATLSDVGHPDRYADVLRTWAGTPPVLVVEDGIAGVLAANGMLCSDDPDGYGVTFDHDVVAGAVQGNYLSNVWPMGDQRFVTEPPELPATVEPFRVGVLVAALHDIAGHDLRADLELTEGSTGEVTRLEGLAVREVRQRVVEPWTASFPIEAALVVEDDGSLLTVGGRRDGLGPFYEEYSARRVRLSLAE